MKARIAALAAVASLALAGTALAEDIETPVGTLTVDAEAGYVLADGASTNEDPADGYILINADGSGCASDQGSPNDADGDGVANADDDDVDGDGTLNEEDTTDDAAATCAP